MRRFLPVLILAAGAALRLAGLGFGLPHTESRPDESVIVGIALRFFSGDYNPRFFEWPSLYFYFVHALLRTAYLAGRVLGEWSNTAQFLQVVAETPAPVFLGLRILSVACGLLTLAEVFKLARQIHDWLTAILAMFFLAVAYLAIREAHFGLLDVPVTLLIVRATRALVATAGGTGSGSQFLRAGIWTGLACALKYNAGVLTLVAAVAALLSRRPWRGNGQWTKVLAVLGVFLAGSITVALLATPYALLDVGTFSRDVGRQFGRLSGGHGVSVHDAWEHHLTFSLRDGLGWPVLLGGIAGCGLSLAREWPRALVLWTFPVAYFLVIGAGETAFVRYASPLVPFLCIGAGYAVREVSLSVTGTPTRIYITASLIAMLMAIPSIVTSVQFDRLLRQRDTRLQAADWLRSHATRGDALYQSGWIYAQPLVGLNGAGDAAYENVDFKSNPGIFVSRSGVPRTPDWIVVARSPLRFYTPVPPALDDLLKSDYRLAAQFAASIDREAESWFDRQDAFFLPYARFDYRSAPGPELTIYTRTDRR
jgi:hypothetical protein